MSAPAGPSVADLVDAGLRRLHRDLTRARAAHQQGRLTWAEWTAVTARLYARRARWWAVLDRAAVVDRSVHPAYLRALVAAVCEAERDARFWAEQAATARPDDVDADRARVG